MTRLKERGCGNLDFTVGSAWKMRSPRRFAPRDDSKSVIPKALIIPRAVVIHKPGSETAGWEMEL
jgi:hypothetical protein